MIKQEFNNVDSVIKEVTDFFETRVENMEPKEEKQKSSVTPLKKKGEENQHKKETR